MTLATPFQAQAQSTLKVPFGSARLVWDVGVPSADQSLPSHHIVYCNGESPVAVPMPATSIAIKNVVPGPGVYTCFIFSENDFSRQVETDIPFPQFQAGNPPVKPTGQRLEVQ